MITIADEADKSVYVRYEKDGKLAFSANYNQGEKKDAFISAPSKNKDIFIRFYEDKMDYVREVNATNPFNYIEYNLALGEYLVYKDNKLIKGGHICGYEKAEDVPEKDISKPEKVEKENPAVTAESKLSSKKQVAAEENQSVKENREIKETIPSAAEQAQPMEIKATQQTAPEVETAQGSTIDKAQSETAEKTEISQARQTEEKVSAEVEDKVKEAEKAQSISTQKVSADKPVAKAIPIIAPKTSKANEPDKAIKAEKETISVKAEEQVSEISPILPEEAAPLVEDLEPISLEDIKVKNAIIPTAEEKKEAELAAKNIGPVSKPDIEDLADVVSKEHISKHEIKPEKEVTETQKLYYPNGNLRKTIKTTAGRTEEIKEYSKTGLLITDTMYEKEGILIEKYYGSGEIRRKTYKDYTDNAVMSFVSREDFYDNGKPRYEIQRKPETLLFTDKEYYPEGGVKAETEQTGALVFITKEYAKDGKIVKETEQHGIGVIEKEYNEQGNIKSLKLNKAEMPQNLAKNSADMLKDSLKVYGKKGGVTSEFKSDNKSNTILEYYDNGKVKTEIIFYNNGEISVKSYDKEGNLAKFAYLAPSGKLHIQKPSVQTIPSYRERYWVDYNNPRWIENQDKYSIKSIARLNMDTAAYILAELKVEVPEVLKKLYDVYK